METLPTNAGEQLIQIIHGPSISQFGYWQQGKVDLWEVDFPLYAAEPKIKKKALALCRFHMKQTFWFFSKLLVKSCYIKLKG